LVRRCKSIVAGNSSRIIEIDRDDWLRIIIKSGHREISRGPVGRIGPPTSQPDHDMYKWDQALYGEMLVKAETLNEAFSPGKLKNGKPTGYGFGWFVKGDQMIHTGSWLGYRTAIVRLPKDQFSVIVLSNVAECHAWNIARKVTELYLAQQRPPTP